MSTVTQIFESATGIQLKEVVVGINPHNRGLSFEAEFENPSASLKNLLSSLGMNVTASQNDLPTQPSKATLYYEKGKGISDGGGYMTSLNVDIEGGVKLGDLLDLSDVLPDTFNPVLDKVLLSFDMDSIKKQGATEKDKYVTIAAYFSQGAGDNKTNYIVKGYHQVSTIGTTNESVFAGNIYSTTGDAIDIDFGSDFPVDLDIKDLFIAKISTSVGKGQPKKNTIYGANLSIDADFDLGSIPVIGSVLKEAKFSFNALHFIYSSAPIMAKDLSAINGFLQKINIPALVTPHSTVANNQRNAIGFPQGFNLQGTLVLGNNAKVIPLHTVFSPEKTAGKSTTGSSKTASLNPQKSNAPGTPSPVGKRYGPVEIKSVSLGFSKGKVAFTFTGGLHLGPLDMQFIGLDITSPFDNFNPDVSLKGFGIDVEKPPLNLSGMFMENTFEIPKKTSDGSETTESVTGYDGSLSVGYQEYAMVAMGSYAKLNDGTTTIFLYGFLGVPLGGLPGILYITGVAAGFGYNRDFTVPTPESINTFPLIQPVMPTGNATFSFDAMNQDFMPDEGEFWGAVGIRVESFKMMESFVLLDVKFGNDLEIDILGLSKMQFPVPDSQGSPELAKILIGIVARILPERGILAINGAFLAGSYIYLPEVHITGGFAMLSIFKDQTSGQWQGGQEGDFIFTLGGYGPIYKPKSYYPKVPRLEMNWRVSNDLSVKADAYFAITPQAMMVGGHLDANFQAGGDFSIHVHFTVGADFIIYWKPYHYIGHMYADLNVSASINVDCWLFTIHASVDFDLGADLKIWGPHFSGHASVHVHVLVSFTVGVSFGESEHELKVIGWDEFSKGFLPKPDKTVTSSIGSGLLTGLSSSDYKVINPKELSLICGSAIPVKAIYINSPVLGVGETMVLSGASGDGSWSSDNPSVAKVDNGNVSGVSEGVAIIVDPAGSKTFITVGQSQAAYSFKNPINSSFGIKPMGNTENDYAVSNLNVAILKKEENVYSFADLSHFSFEPINKNMPAALWQKATQPGQIPQNDTDSLIAGLTNGLKISTHTQLPLTPVTVPANEPDVINTPASKQLNSFSYAQKGYKKSESN